MPIEFFSYAHSEYGALYRHSNNTFFEGALLVVCGSVYSYMPIAYSEIHQRYSAYFDGHLGKAPHYFPF